MLECRYQFSKLMMKPLLEKVLSPYNTLRSTGKKSNVQPKKTTPAPNVLKQEEPAAKKAQHHSFASLVRACLNSLKKD